MAADPFAALHAEARRLRRPGPPPASTEPMLATLTDWHFTDPGWLFERKFDGGAAWPSAGRGG